MDELFSMPNLTQVLKEYGDYLVVEYKDNLEIDNHRATGKLLSSIHTTINMGDKEYSVDLHLEDYYKYVENGRLKGGKFPPMNKILEWIRVKPVLPREDKNGRIPTENQLAYLIGRKIANEGIEKGGELALAIETTNNYWWSKIEQAIEQDLYDKYQSIVNILMV